MKLNKLILVSIFLLATLALGAVSASEDLEVGDISSSNIITNPDFSGLYTTFSDSDIITAEGNVANTNEIYVNTTGDDSGAGSQKSPYATINKGISSANASDNTIIYLSEGTFAGDNNTELNINLAHGKYGGSLTIIGQGTDKTKIDGEGVGSFIKSVSGDTALTLINISFINGKSNSGSMITCGGNLTINNCLFENNYATGSQGTIVAKGMSLKVTNSIFRNNTASNQGPDICFNNNNGDVVITNSTFSNSVNTGYSCGASVYISSSKNAKITGNTFKDISANYNDAALQIDSSNGQIEYNTFINCTNTNTDTGYWAQYGVIYIKGVNLLKGNKFINSSSNMGLIYNNGAMNAIVTFANTSTTKTTFTLNATVTDDMGNIISSPYEVEFNMGGKKVGESTVNKGIASITVSKLFDNGKYIIDGAYSGNLNTYHKGTLDIDIDRTLVEFWVSTKGNDTTGDGSKLNPFNTIDHAITAALDKSINIAIHIMDGTYNGTGNVNLKYERIAILSLIGETHGNTIIDGQNKNYFFSFNKEMIVTMTNLTFANGLAGNIGWNRGVIYGALMTMNDCIIMNCSSVSNIVYDVDTQNSNLVFNNLTYINNNGNMWLGYATINNSYFANNVGNSLGGVIRGTNSLTVTNSKFINNTNPKNSNAEGGAIYAKDIISINNIYDSNHAGTKGGAVYISGSEKATFINDTFINNRAAGEGGAVYSYGSSNSFIPLVIFENVKFINNTGAKGGAAAVSGATFNKVTFKDNHADIGGAIYLVPVTNGKNNNIQDLTISDDSSFENNNAPEGKDIYISTPVANEGIANVTGLTITFNDLHVTALADKLSASVTHASGAVISGNTVTFFIGGKYAGISDVINGVATYNYVGFEDGKYSLSGTYNANGKNYIYKNGTITVAISGILDSITVYVSDAKGNDSTADGSLAKPFKSIRAALEYAQSKSRTVIVNVLEGNYSGNLNVNLDIQVNIDISIIGAGENKTIISDATAKYFIKALQGKSSLKIANMTIDRVGDYLNSMLYIEENVHVLIDTVEFINGKGNLGGAIYSDGILTIKNSYFFNNGYANADKRQNAIAGGAIYNGGTLRIDNTTFEANHATRASTIANQGNLYMNNSQIIDSISAPGLNMDLRVIASYNLGQVGNITLENTKILLTGRTPVDIVGSDNLYQGDRSVTCLGIGSSEKVIFINVTVDGNGSTTSGSYVFGGFNSWVETGGRSQTPKDIHVYNSTFANLKSVNVYYLKINSTRIFDGCIFDNVDYLVDVITAGAGDSLTIKNSVILGETKVGKVANVNLNISLDNNWWGNNNGTYYEAVIRYVNGMNPSINEVSKVNATPNTWLVLTLDVTNKTGLIQEVILAFKVFNGTNLTDYTGSLPARNFNMSMVNGTLSMVNGTITNIIISGFEANEGDYTIIATVDGQSVTLSGSAYLGKAIIEVNDVVMDYNEIIIVNATLRDDLGNSLVNVNVTLRVNGKVYHVVTDENGVASFVIEQLAPGNYTLDYSISGDKVISETTNSSSLIINKAKNNMKVNISAGVAGEDVIINVAGSNDATGNITISVNNKNYNVALVNGSASLTLKDLTDGFYNVNIVYSGDKNYEKQVINTNLTVEINKNVNIDVNNIVMFYHDGTRLVAVLTDYKGNPIANATIYFVINGVTYARITDVNGSASMALNLKAGIYNASVLFNGTDKYGKVAKNTTVIIRSTIESVDIIKMYQNGTQFFAKFFDKNGNLLSNTNVTFNINGVFYTRETNKDGVARLAINLRPGKYILTAINPVNSEEQGFNITVRSLIEAGDLTKYFQNASKFEATIYNKDGSLAVNKEVTFNINGVFYKRTTNDKGVVSLAINLRPGNYTITTMYDGLEMGNNVNVLPTLETKDLSMKFRDGSKFTAKTVDGQGKPLANQNVTFNVNGVFYHKVSDANGIASLNINLIAGEYVITSIWNDFQVGNKITII
ncbi:S-layer family protein [uncultured Methanobrevibacter sp.]|uniref:beta strand repeat-containing protein n=1 Tax=uncultured Methanobrevibacter sp. TaxID=253161 RepID=UPI0026026A8E|nr:Ig-like domain repeat protein [uncultured Methanobrevibacter sp.]